VSPTQQPVEHDAALQTHCPLPLHCCVAVHMAHGAPLVPQVNGPLVLHSLLPSQHPVHDIESHTQLAPSQRWPVMQVLQGPPPLPQVAIPGVVTQMLPLQHPSGHDVGLQTHCPALHARPVSHF
jgi:hypothetical protein